MPQYNPQIIIFCCEWNPYIAAENAGAEERQYPVNIKIFKLNCTGSITPRLILNAFENAADGVLIGACGKGECHYVTGNETAEKIVAETRQLLKLSGIDSRRLGFELFVEMKGEYFVSVVTKFFEQIASLGPLLGKEAA